MTWQHLDSVKSSCLSFKTQKKAFIAEINHLNQIVIHLDVVGTGQHFEFSENLSSNGENYYGH